MSDATKPPEEPESVESSDDAIARLIRLAGPRPPVPQERVARVRGNVHARWREALRRDRRRIVVLVAAPLAAAIIVVIGAGFWLRDRIGATGARAATVARTEGRVLLRDGRVAEPGGILVAGAGPAAAPPAPPAPGPPPRPPPRPPAPPRRPPRPPPPPHTPPRPGGLQ